jgi:hypothetical protein
MNRNAYSSTRSHDDSCYVTQQWQQNQDFAEYYLTNHREEEEKTRIGMTRWGGHGIPSSVIDHDSELRQGIKTERIKTSNFRTDCYDHNGDRTGFCSANFGANTAPSGASGIQYPAEPQKCRFQDQLAKGRNEPQCGSAFNQVTEESPNKYSPIAHVEPWVRGGIITRHNLRNKDEANKAGQVKKLTQCNRPYLG